MYIDPKEGAENPAPETAPEVNAPAEGGGEGSEGSGALAE